MGLFNLRVEGRDQTLDQLFSQLLALGRWQSQRIIKHLPGIRCHETKSIPKPRRVKVAVPRPPHPKIVFALFVIFVATSS